MAESLRDQERAVAEVLAQFPATVIGGRLRRAREKQKWSVRDAAEAAGLNKSSVVRVEKGDDARPITILKMCAALGLHVERLAEPDHHDAVAIHRQEDDRWYDLLDFGAGTLGGQNRPLSPEERDAFARKGGCSPILILQSHLAQGKVIPAIIEAYAPSTPRSHPGEEFVYVLSGTAKIGVSGVDYVLKEGESMEFWGSEPHSYGSNDNKPARILSIRISP